MEGCDVQIELTNSLKRAGRSVTSRKVYGLNGFAEPLNNCNTVAETMAVVDYMASVEANSALVTALVKGISPKPSRYEITLKTYTDD